MKTKFWVLCFSIFILMGCRTPLGVAIVETAKNEKINEEIPSDSLLEKVILPYKISLEKNMNQKIAYTEEELTKTGDNSSLGNLLADYTLEGAREWAKDNGKMNIDAAVINIGGIRNNIGKGDILIKNIFEVMPFENELVVMKMTGNQMRGLFNYYLQNQKNNPVSGIIIETENQKITKALVQGKTINDNHIYYIATSDFLALGGDGMKFFSDGVMISTGIKLRDLYINIFKNKQQIIAPKDLRLLFNDKK